MELHERLSQRAERGARRSLRGPVLRDQEQDSPGADRGSRPAAVQHRDGPGDAAPAGPGGASRAPGPRAGHLARGSRPDAVELTADILGHGPLERLLEDDTRDGDHGQRTVSTCGWSERDGCTRRRSGSPTTSICSGSSARWWPRSAAGSTSPRRWSTPACRTAAVSTPRFRRSPSGPIADDPEVRQAPAWTWTADQGRRSPPRPRSCSQAA